MMDIDIVHNRLRMRFETTADGVVAYTEYTLREGTLDIMHTIVPEEISGRGIAAALVKATFDYAVTEGLICAGSCPYAAKWLSTHPEYSLSTPISR